MNEFVKYSVGNHIKFVEFDIRIFDWHYHKISFYGRKRQSRYNLIWFGHASGQNPKPFMMYVYPFLSDVHTFT